MSLRIPLIRELDLRPLPVPPAWLEMSGSVRRAGQEADERAINLLWSLLSHAERREAKDTGYVTMQMPFGIPARIMVASPRSGFYVPPKRFRPNNAIFHCVDHRANYGSNWDLAVANVTWARQHPVYWFFTGLPNARLMLQHYESEVLTGIEMIADLPPRDRAMLWRYGAAERYEWAFQDYGSFHRITSPRIRKVARILDDCRWLTYRFTLPILEFYHYEY